MKICFKNIQHVLNQKHRDHLVLINILKDKNVLNKFNLNHY